jgi:hypothetical protein
MRFDPSKCPECGQQATGTLETIPGIALLMFDEDGAADYQGETRVCWDGQMTVRAEDGLATLVCPDGHDWLAVMDDSDPACPSPPEGDPA